MACRTAQWRHTLQKALHTETQTMSFNPTDLTKLRQPQSFASIPSKQWLPVHSNPCAIPTAIFNDVMLNLVRNPNINSSYLFRADILFDSSQAVLQQVPRFGHDSSCAELEDETPRPLDIQIEGFDRTRSLVRKLIPRNTAVDSPLLQTCHFFSRGSIASSSTPGDAENLVIYQPHAANPTEIPFYHPPVQALAFHHRATDISIHYALFPSSTTTDTEKEGGLEPRLQRTAWHLLHTAYKHSQGNLAGYVKRVHHDVITPQARYQNRYARLKAKHARRLLDAWAETTDPSKHVFEDLGIAAYLIELWREMYTGGVGGDEEEGDGPRETFPGFVDIGCGNGVLVDILTREGWNGWGFDARRRKSWATFATETQARLKEMILVPAPLVASCSSGSCVENPSPCPSGDLGLSAAVSREIGSTNEDSLLSTTDFNSTTSTVPFHNGLFPPSTFIISNHADELTGYTPILAALADHAPFLIIPCCSHDLSGARFRAPVKMNARSPLPTLAFSSPSPSPTSHPERETAGNSPASETISCQKTDGIEAKSTSSPRNADAQKSQPSKGRGLSAYAALVEWTAAIAHDLGYEVERDMLRIPSTRNAALVGRRRRELGKGEAFLSVEEVLRKYASAGSSGASHAGAGAGAGDASRADAGDVTQTLAQRWIQRALRMRSGAMKSGH